MFWHHFAPSFSQKSHSLSNRNLSIFRHIRQPVLLSRRSGTGASGKSLFRSMKGKMEPEQRQALIEEGKKIKEDSDRLGMITRAHQYPYGSIATFVTS